MKRMTIQTTFTDRSTGDVLFLDYVCKWMRQYPLETVGASLVEVLISVPDHSRQQVLDTQTEMIDVMAGRMRIATERGNVGLVQTLAERMINMAKDMEERSRVMNTGDTK